MIQFFCASPRAHILALFLSLSLTLWTQPATAEIYFFSDFDGTVFADREGPGEDGEPRVGQWVTTYRLFRTDHLAHGVLPLAGLESPFDEVQISHMDFERYKMDLSLQVSGLPTAVPLYAAWGKTRSRPEHLQSIESFIPGHYTISGQTYDHFQAPMDSQNAPTEDLQIVKDYRQAKQRQTDTGGALFGYGFETLQHHLSLPELAIGTRILTARGGPVDAMDRFFQVLKKEGYFEHLPLRGDDLQPQGYQLLGAPYMMHFFGSHVGKKKVQALEFKINQLLKRSPKESVLTPTGDGKGLYHTIIFAEDNIEYLLQVYELARDITMRGLHRIKFVFLVTSPKKELPDLQWQLPGGQPLPRALVVTPTGLRPANKEEYLIPHETAQIANSGLLQRLSCERLLK